MCGGCIAGRIYCANLLKNVIEHWRSTLKDADKDAKALAPAIVYVSFLLSAYDGEHRVAFNLLYRLLK